MVVAVDFLPFCPLQPLLVAFDNTRLTVYRYFIHGCLLTTQMRSASNNSKHNIVNDSPNKTSKATNNLDIISGQCRAVGTTRIPYGHIPLSVAWGEVCLLSPTGRLITQLLATHAFRAHIRGGGTGTDEQMELNKVAEMETQLPTACTQNIEDQKPGQTRNRSVKRQQSSADLNKLTLTDLQTYFDQAMRAGCFDDAWVFAERMDSERHWNQLGHTCLRVMQFELAIRAFRKSQNTGLVLSLQRIQRIEDELLLAGYVAMILKEFDQAQELFLVSSRPLAALEMRRDLLHWDTALQLARTLAPHEIPAICREYAVEMEYIGDYVNALMHFEQALSQPDTTAESDAFNEHRNPSSDGQWVKRNGDLFKSDMLKSSEWGEENPKWTEHVELCNAGIARNAIRLGDFKRGIQLARDSSNPALQKNCADILEQMKQWQEAASLYELAGLYEASATVYLRCKSYKQAGELLKRIPNAPRLHLQYAKAREADGAFREAVVAYEAAHDWDSVVRLQLEKLGNIEEAVRVVRETKSIDGAKMIAQYFTRINDHASAIQFLVLSKCLDTAFQLAQKHRKMELYAEYIGQDANVSEYQSIAHYFENEKNWYMAGKFYLMAKQYEKAIRNLLRSPYTENSPALDLALEAVGLADDTRLTHLLIVYLMGEADGVPKDARHLFRLYMVLKQYKEAARTAVIIAREEQTAGNYRSAHDLLFSLVQELKQRDLRVPAEMADNLALLHSYVLAKVHVKHGDHVRAAKMLIRVAENISKFPSHVVPILTSTVIECQKAGLKTESFGYAAMLLRPEYREKLDPKHRRKFETLIRRPDRKPEHMGEDQPDQVNSEVDPATPCPSCSCLLVGSSLYCTECRNTLPYCIITVRR
ncbi:WD repeat-containing protein 19 [Paragonimus westermani]|uniref:WD repeat-containing protein 19 n=1 Tax=Paragonimus westermani TaxID=34504 RepID=A0A5J4NLA0_9TREM|nr:WD repeat-containing protein 19 [Paragonimus westermani]